MYLYATFRQARRETKERMVPDLTIEQIEAAIAAGELDEIYGEYLIEQIENERSER